MVPLWFDVGYRLSPALYLGAFFQYGFAFVNKDNATGCDQGISCSAHDISFGANLHYHILPRCLVRPLARRRARLRALTASESGSTSFRCANPHCRRFRDRERVPVLGLGSRR